MLSGGQLIKVCGFVVLYLGNRYIVILSMKNKQWKLDIFVFLFGWFNFVFMWRENGKFKFYVNGIYVVSGNFVLVFRFLDLFMIFYIGWLNNFDKLLYSF